MNTFIKKVSLFAFGAIFALGGFLVSADLALAESDCTPPEGGECGEVDENMTIDVSPAKDSLIELADGETFSLTVDASDVSGGLYELEIDHNMESAETPPFSVYANSEDPYNGDGETGQLAVFQSFGLSVTYIGDENDGTWTIDFGTDITDAFIDNEGIEFYLRVKDVSGDRFSGPFSGTTAENTFAYTVARVDENMTIDVSPAKDSLIELADGETFSLTVDASDVSGGLYELEIDHNMESAETPPFSVYANSEDPYNGDGETGQLAVFQSFGLSVTYIGDENDGTWTIDFGTDITDAFIDNEGIEFYLRVKDVSGDRFSGPFSGTTAENTFAYTVARGVETTPEPTPEVNPPSSSRGGGGGRSSSRRDLVVQEDIVPENLVLENLIAEILAAGNTNPQILGAETEFVATTVCSNFTENMRFGDYDGDGDTSQVERLQGFLNQELNLNLVLDGKFGPATQGASVAFQEKYQTDILAPWGLTTGTGLFYTTSRTKANQIMG